ncbi:MAG: DNA-binding response regulator [Bacteroidales bacterium]|nr:DNA-binding response regulator [Bacteroidales bacterium]
MDRSYFILDDDRHAVERMEELMKSYPAFRHAGSETSPEKAIAVILSNRPGILFIDVEMPGYNGMDVICRIRKDNYAPVVVFVTAHEKYAIQAIKHSAFDYILKPVSKTDLEETLNRITEKNRNKNKYKQDELIELLTAREKEVLELLRHCLTSHEIATRMNISAETVYTYRRRIIKKLQLGSTKEIPVLFPPKRQ